MSVVIPFRALRPGRSFAKEVASLPYDVLNRDEARALASGNPVSFLRVEKSEIDVNPPDDVVPEKIFEKAKENLSETQLYPVKAECLMIILILCFGHFCVEVCRSHGEQRAILREFWQSGTRH